MKIFKDRSTSRNTSRTSSNLSLNELTDFNDENENVNVLNIETENENPLLNIDLSEPSIPVDTDEVTNYYKWFMANHPLGGLLLKLASLNIELCKKNNIPEKDTLDLGETCRDFVKAVHLERGKLTNKVASVTSDIENSILNKELNFHSVNASIVPPTKFSPAPVIVDSRKLNEVLKSFPSRTHQKFSGGAPNGVTILEFLQAMNTGQELMNLSRTEFLKILQKCVSGKVYNLVSECITYGTDISDLYHSLLTLYDTRISSANARKILASYKAPRNHTLTKVQSYILEVASRVASQIPPGPSRTAMFNLEANSALVRCLPSNSSILVTNITNTLTAKLQRLPSYVELTKSLTKYGDTINSDLERNGVMPTRSNAKGYIRPDFKVYSMNRFNSRQHEYNRNGQSRNHANKGLKVNAIANRKLKASPRNERAYNINKNYNSGRKNLYCSLCGDNNHTASNICYKMRDDNNRLIQVIPTYRHCEVCLEKLNKKLFHPASACISREAYLKILDSRNKRD